MIDIKKEIPDLIATRNRPMLTALELCIDQLERLNQGDPATVRAIECARKAVALERKFQAG